MRTAAAAAALGLTLLTAGLASCADPGGPPLVPPPEPGSTPVFASDEEALAAAEEAYARYESVTNMAGQGGWTDTSAYADVLAGSALADELEGAQDLAAKGWRQVGAATHDTVSLQQVDDKGGGDVEIVIYLCADVSAVDVVDPNGSSVVSAARPNRQPFEVWIIDTDGTLKVGRTDPWSGTSFC